MVDQLLSDLITVLVYVLAYLWASMVIAVILLANAYALYHSWRSGKWLWLVVIAVGLFVGAGLPTAAYLIVHRDELYAGRFGTTA